MCLPSPLERQVRWEGWLLAFGTEKTWLLALALASQLELTSQPGMGIRGCAGLDESQGTPKLLVLGNTPSHPCLLPAFKYKAPFLLYHHLLLYRNTRPGGATALRENAQVPGSCSEIQSSLKISETGGNEAVIPERVSFYQAKAR